MSRKAKILFILHLPGPIHGASLVGKFIRDSRLVNEEFDCHYINMTTAKSLEDIGRGGIKKYMLFVWLLLRITGVIITKRPNMVYVTPNSAGAPFYKDFVVVETAKLLAKKVVLHFHNKGVAKRQDYAMDDRLYRRFFKGAKVILLADMLYEDVKKYVKREDVVVCPNGIPESEIVEHITHNGCELLYLSNLLKTKGVYELLDAMQLLKLRCKEIFHLTMVGGTTIEISREQLKEAIAKRDITDVVSYIGKRYGKDKLDLFAKSDVFILPTYTEAFPLSTLEAMEQSLPIVITPVGGVPEQIFNKVNGLLVTLRFQNSEFSVATLDDSFTERLANALQYMIEHTDKRNQMGTKGREIIVNKFTLEKFERNFIAALSKFLY